MIKDKPSKLLHVVCSQKLSIFHLTFSADLKSQGIRTEKFQWQSGDSQDKPKSKEL